MKNTIIMTLLIFFVSLAGVILLPISLGSNPDSIMNKNRIVVRIQAFHKSISKTGTNDKAHLPYSYFTPIEKAPATLSLSEPVP